MAERKAQTFMMILSVLEMDDDEPKRNNRKRKIWMKKWLTTRSREGAYATILNDLRIQDPQSFRKYLRMNEETFQVRKYQNYFSQKIIKHVYKTQDLAPWTYIFVGLDNSV